MPQRLELFAAPTFADLVGQLSPLRPPAKAARMVYGGAIIGLKDGENSFKRLEKLRAAGVKVPACVRGLGWVYVTRPSAPPVLGLAGERNPLSALRQKIAELNDDAYASSATSILSRGRRPAIPIAEPRAISQPTRTARQLGGLRRIRLRRCGFHQPRCCGMVCRRGDRQEHAGLRPFRLDGRFRRIFADRRQAFQRVDRS